MMGRHIDAVLNLARLHPGYATPAQTLARVVMEQSMRAAWLLEPETAVDREQRWVATEAEKLRFHKDVGLMDEEQFGALTNELSGVAETGGGEKVKGIPSMEQLCERFSPEADLYTFYRFLSQPIHGTAFGAGTFDYDYRFDWNEVGGEGEWIEAEFWNMPLLAIWDSAAVAMTYYRDRLIPGHSLTSIRRRSEFVATLQRVPPNFQARRTIEESKPSTPVPNRQQRRQAERRRRRAPRT